MNENLQLLLIGLGVVSGFVWFFFPDKGLLARWKKIMFDSKRVKIEDALKHLYDCEYNGLMCTINSVAGNLSINSDQAAKLVEKLESMSLISNRGNTLVLTPKGRGYALKIIRVHRLWERFLADETGLNEVDWHHDAEIKEHQISLDEANSLAAQIGNPLFDPHGDPIPTSSGEIPSKRGMPISQLKIGELAQIIHIEDEPTTIYSQLVAAGLHLGQVVRINGATNDRIVLEADGEQIILAPTFAGNITVERLPSKISTELKFKTLSQLKIGEKGKVMGISKACRGQQRRRLLDLGIVPGTEVYPEIESAGGDPTGYKIRGATIALRKHQSDMIFINDN